jgi:hypothetical protein
MRPTSVINSLSQLARLAKFGYFTYIVSFKQSETDMEHMVNSKSVVLTGAALALLLLSGCAHQVVFDDAHHYTIDESMRSEPMVAVISEEEIARTDRTRAFTTGIAHGWDAEPGVMLEQVTDIEMPQMFNSFEISRVQTNNPDSFHLILAIPEYQFANYHARMTVDAQLLSPDNQTLLEKSYFGSGPGAGGRMWAGGAFTMKSAMRQSSIGALKDIFEKLRSDLNAVLDEFSGSQPESAE